MSGRLTALAVALLTTLAPVPAAATLIGLWRMEADLDPSAGGLEVANEVAFGNPLLSNEAFIDLAANPNSSVPSTGSPNLGSVGATQQGGSNGINGTVAWYPELDSASLTIELWARTVESTATIFSRSSGANGLLLDTPNDLQLTYYVSDGGGGGTAVVLSTGHDMDATWRHYAFTYDALSGVGSFFVDGVEVATNDGPDARPLFWGTQVDLEVGFQLDFAAANNGTVDELRIDDNSLPAMGFQNVPEPGTASALALGLGALAAWRRLRAR